MATQKRVTNLVAEIRKKYRKVIDLEKSPLVLVEIVHQYGEALKGVGGGVAGGDAGGTGGVSPGTSTVAVGVNSGRSRFGEDGDGGGTGGVSPGTSTVAVGITPPESGFGHLELEEILKAVLKLQKEVSSMVVKIERIAGTR